jgi:hypothetical protein
MHDESKRRGLPPKTCWITYGLQGLSTEKFLSVVQQILEGNLILLKPLDPDQDNPEMTEEHFLTQN